MDLTTVLLLFSGLALGLTFTEPADFEVSATEPKTAAELRAFMDDTNSQLWEDINAGAAGWEGRMKFAYPQCLGNIKLSGCFFRTFGKHQFTQQLFCELTSGHVLLSGRAYACVGFPAGIHGPLIQYSANNKVQRAFLVDQGDPPVPYSDPDGIPYRLFALVGLPFPQVPTDPCILLGTFWYDGVYSHSHSTAPGPFPWRARYCVGQFINGRSMNGTSAHNGSR